MKIRRFAGVLLVLICLFGAAAAQAAVKTDFSVSTAEKLEAAFKYVKKHGVTEFTVTMDADLYKKMTADDHYALKRELLKCGADRPGSYTYYTSSRRFEFNVTWTDRTGYAVTTKNELKDAVKSSIKKGAAQYTLVLGKKLYAAMSEDDFAAYYTLLGSLCVSRQNFTYYSTLHVIMVNGVTVPENGKYVTTLDAAKDYIKRMSDKESEEYWIFMSPSLYKKILQEKVSDYGAKITRFSALMNYSGVFDWHYRSNDAYHYINPYGLEYYPGWRILNAVNSGSEGSLDSMDQRALSAARKIVDRLDISKYSSGTKSTKKAAAIAEALAAGTVYRVVNAADYDDCAYGPLLYGEANCDGYSDAFYLCAGLAGLRARMMQGYALEPYDRSSDTHVWNLLKIGGKWYLVDVTWCDSDPEEKDYVQIRFSNFLLGIDRIKREYGYFADIAPEIASKTDVSLMPYTVHRCSTDDAIRSALRTGIKGRQKQFLIWYGGSGSMQAVYETAKAFLTRQSAISRWAVSWSDDQAVMQVKLTFR